MFTNHKKGTITIKKIEYKELWGGEINTMILIFDSIVKAGNVWND